MYKSCTETRYTITKLCLSHQNKNRDHGNLGLTHSSKGDFGTASLVTLFSKYNALLNACIHKDKGKDE